MSQYPEPSPCVIASHTKPRLTALEQGEVQELKAAIAVACEAILDASPPELPALRRHAKQLKKQLHRTTHPGSTKKSSIGMPWYKFHTTLASKQLTRLTQEHVARRELVRQRTEDAVYCEMDTSVKAEQRARMEAAAEKRAKLDAGEAAMVAAMTEAHRDVKGETARLNQATLVFYRVISLLNGDGYNEEGAVIKKHELARINKGHLLEFDAVDADSNGLITLEEWVSHLAEQAKRRDEPGTEKGAKWLTFTLQRLSSNVDRATKQDKKRRAEEMMELARAEKDARQKGMEIAAAAKAKASAGAKLHWYQSILFKAEEAKSEAKETLRIQWERDEIEQAQVYAEEDTIRKARYRQSLIQLARYNAEAEAESAAKADAEAAASREVAEGLVLLDEGDALFSRVAVLLTTDDRGLDVTSISKEGLGRINKGHFVDFAAIDGDSDGAVTRTEWRAYLGQAYSTKCAQGNGGQAAKWLRFTLQRMRVNLDRAEKQDAKLAAKAAAAEAALEEEAVRARAKTAAALAKDEWYKQVVNVNAKKEADAKQAAMMKKMQKEEDVAAEKKRQEAAEAFAEAKRREEEDAAAEMRNQVEEMSPQVDALLYADADAVFYEMATVGVCTGAPKAEGAYLTRETVAKLGCGHWLDFDDMRQSGEAVVSLEHWRAYMMRRYHTPGGPTWFCGMIDGCNAVLRESSQEDMLSRLQKHRTGLLKAKQAKQTQDGKASFCLFSRECQDPLLYELLQEAERAFSQVVLLSKGLDLPYEQMCGMDITLRKGDFAEFSELPGEDHDQISFAAWRIYLEAQYHNKGSGISGLGQHWLRFAAGRLIRLAEHDARSKAEAETEELARSRKPAWLLQTLRAPGRLRTPCPSDISPSSAPKKYVRLSHPIHSGRSLSPLAKQRRRRAASQAGDEERQANHDRKQKSVMGCLFSGPRQRAWDKAARRLQGGMLGALTRAAVSTETHRQITVELDTERSAVEVPEEDDWDDIHDHLDRVHDRVTRRSAATRMFQSRLRGQVARRHFRQASKLATLVSAVAIGADERKLIGQARAVIDVMEQDARVKGLVGTHAFYSRPVGEEPAKVRLVMPRPDIGAHAILDYRHIESKRAKDEAAIAAATCPEYSTASD